VTRCRMKDFTIPLRGKHRKPETEDCLAGQFRTVVLDPPWWETGGAAKSKAFGVGARGADQHYPLMKTPDILTTIQESGVFNPADNAHMWMWTTKRFLTDGLWVMDQLGFRYVTMLTWVKTDKRIGMGRYFRGRSEPLLFGVRGKGLDPSVCTDHKALDDLVLAPRTTHSRKPAESYLKIEARSKGPYLEMFGRGSFDRPGWECWGQQAIETGATDADSDRDPPAGATAP